MEIYTEYHTYTIFRVDDPLIWGVLPFSYAFSPGNHRWSLGSYDICFQSKYVASTIHHCTTFADYNLGLLLRFSTLDRYFLRTEAIQALHTVDFFNLS